VGYKVEAREPQRALHLVFFMEVEAEVQAARQLEGGQVDILHMAEAEEEDMQHLVLRFQEVRVFQEVPGGMAMAVQAHNLEEGVEGGLQLEETAEPAKSA
jgi:hypothetical protein